MFTSVKLFVDRGFRMFLFTPRVDKFITYNTIGILLFTLFIIKMINETSLLEEYVNFVDTTKKQTKYFKIIIILIAIIMFLFFFVDINIIQV